MKQPKSAPLRAPQISTTMSVGTAAIMLSVMIALSRVAGFGRLVLTSYLYGISPVTDAYNAAFNIPDTVSILVAGGALATGFVPVLSSLVAKGETVAAQRTFRAMLTLLTVAFGGLTIILFALTYTPWGLLLAPQKVTPEVGHLYLQILRILLFAQFIYVLGGLFSGTLNALRLFWYAALQPVAFNFGIIILGIILPKTLGWGIESQAWGALLGAVIGSVFIQIPGILRNGLSLRPLWDFGDPGVREVLRTILPIVFGLSSGQLIALTLPKFFAIGFAGGDITALDNANRLMQVPLAVFASGPAIAILPTLSILHAEGNVAKIREQLTSLLRRVLLLILFSTALMMALRVPIVHLLLEHGKFDAADTEFTAKVLFCYSLGLVGLCLQQILARGFYAMHDVLPPVIIGAVTMVLYCVLAAIIAYATPWGAMGLASAAALSLTALGIAMAWILRRNLGGWDGGKTRRIFLEGVLASIIAFVAAHMAGIGLTRLLAQFDTDQTLMIIKLVARLTMLSGGAIVGAIAFVIAATLLGIEELGPLRRLVPACWRK